MAQNDYDKWLEELAASRPETREALFWETLAENADRWARETDVGDFKRTVEERLPLWRQRWSDMTGSALLPSEGLPKFQGKGSRRIRTKAFRDRDKKKNPEPLLGLWRPTGPPVPYHDDLVRTRWPCLFLDGVGFLVDRLAETAKEKNIRHQRLGRALPQGYFAQHFYFESDFLFKFGGGSEPVKILCEVQVATQLSTRIWQESHPVYEEDRESTVRDEQWAWDPNDARFLARQLGHTLHLADGVLVQLRKLTRKGEKK